MASSSDQTVGWSIVSLAGFIFTYYTLWLIVLPFVDPDQPIHQYFLPRVYAIAVPLVTGVISLGLIGTFIAYETLKSRRAKKSN